MTYTKAKYGHADDCPDAPTHTPHPDGYFWAIWREKPAAVLRPPTPEGDAGE